MARRGGWRRLGRRRFRYVDARGEPITDENTLERIRQLAIPPAWSDVWISPRASARLQATGIDGAGRRQYLYPPVYRAQQEQAKFDRLVRFGELLPGLRERADEHLRGDPLGREWTCAVAVSLIDRGWFRVGSDRYARNGRTYGVTTLTKRHVTVQGRRVRFVFRAKHRVLVRTTIADARIASAVDALLELEGGSRLLRFMGEAGPANLTATMLNRYIAEHLGEGFTAKDFRTWGGTLAAAVALAEREPPGSAAEERRTLAAVMRRVAADLGNTPAVARSSYVSPAVIEQWRDGRTLEAFRGPRLRVAGTEGPLTPDEEALLSLLRSWRIRRARAA
jgi:DNA topoisomerase IB